jgi:pyridoxine 4-dehydrogenase
VNTVDPEAKQTTYGDNNFSAILLVDNSKIPAESLAFTGGNPVHLLRGVPSPSRFPSNKRHSRLYDLMRCCAAFVVAQRCHVSSRPVRDGPEVIVPFATLASHSSSRPWLLKATRPQRSKFLEEIVKNKTVAAGNVNLGELSVHRLGFGAMRLTGDGIWGPPKDRKTAIAVLRRAVELGVNFIDTADSYGPHVNEELIAEALFPYPAGLVIATKGGWNRPGPNQWTHDATPAHLREAVDGSLKRLRLERIDVYQLHTPDPVVSFDDSVGTLARLKEQGKIRCVALSNVTQEHIERARRIVPIVSVQNRYSFADREWDYVADYCERNSIAFIPWFPLGAGRVAGDTLRRVARARNVAPMQVALAWLLKRSRIMLPIPGTSSVQHLEENVGAASVDLTDEEFQSLSRVPRLVATR